MKISKTKKHFSLYGLVYLLFLIFSAPDVHGQQFELTVQSGHSMAIQSVCFSPDGKVMASLGMDGALKIWSFDGILIRTIVHQRQSQVENISFTSDGQQILAGQNLWNIDGTLVREIPFSFIHNDGMKTSGIPVASAVLSEQHVFYTMSKDYPFVNQEYESIYMISYSSQYMQKFEGHTAFVNSICISPCGSYLLSSSDDHSIILWDISGSLIKKFVCHDGPVLAAAFSPDGDYIVSTGEDKKIKIWNMEDENFSLAYTIEGFSTPAHCVKFMPNGKQIIARTMNGEIIICMLNGKIVHSFKINTVQNSRSSIANSHPFKIANRRGYRPINSIAVSPDGLYILAVLDDQSMKIFTIGGEFVQAMIQNIEPIAVSAVHPTLPYIIYGYATLSLWDLQGNFVRHIRNSCGKVSGLAFTPGVLHFAASGYGNSNIIISDFSGNQVQEIQNTNTVSSLAYSADGSILATGHADGRISVYTSNCSVLNNFIGSPPTLTSERAPQNDVKPILVLPDNKRVAFRTANRIVLINDFYGKSSIQLANNCGTTSGNISMTFDGKYFAFTPFEKLAERRYRNEGIQIKSAEGTLINSFGVQNSAFQYCTISPDGKYIAASKADGVIALYDFSGTFIKEFLGHYETIKGLHFSSDSKYLISHSMSDPSVKIWNIENGNVFNLLQADGEWIIYTPDGYFDSSKNGGRLVGITRGTEAFTVDQFAPRLNRPDIILSRMFPENTAVIKHYRHKTVWCAGSHFLSFFRQFLPSFSV